MARLLEFILFAVVAYFVFKTLNRLFSSSPKKNNYSSKPRQNKTQEKTKSQLKNDINWDAETIDYEEIENKNNEKK